VIRFFVAVTSLLSYPLCLLPVADMLDRPIVNMAARSQRCIASISPQRGSGEKQRLVSKDRPTPYYWASTPSDVPSSHAKELMLPDPMVVMPPVEGGADPKAVDEVGGVVTSHSLNRLPTSSSGVVTESYITPRGGTEVIVEQPTTLQTPASNQVEIELGSRPVPRPSPLECSSPLWDDIMSAPISSAMASSPGIRGRSGSASGRSSFMSNPDLMFEEEEDGKESKRCGSCGTCEDIKHRALVRTPLVVLTTAIAVGLPCFGEVVGLVGSFSVALVSFVLPCIIHFKLCRKMATKSAQDNKVDAALTLSDTLDLEAKGQKLTIDNVIDLIGFALGTILMIAASALGLVKLIEGC